MLKVPNSTITSAINRLETQKLLTRSIQPNDRRTFLLTLTPKGLELINSRQSEKRQLFHYILSSLDNDEERQLLIKLISKLNVSLKTVNKDLLRRIHMDTLQTEYDAFGPWITIIKDDTAVPPQFSKEISLILNANYAFKIPRTIDRRDVNLGMPLYNSVIAVYDDKLILLAREESEIKTSTIFYNQIQYIQSLRNLLFGELLIVSNNKEYAIHYNPLSHDIIEKLVSDLREKYYTKSAHIDMETLDEHINVQTPIFRNILLNDMANEEVKLIEYQPFLELIRQKPSTLDFLIDLYSKPVLQDSLFLTNGKELIILNREKEVKREKEIDYGYKKTFIPLDYITGLSLSTDTSISNLKNLEFEINGAKLMIKIGAEVNVKNIESLINQK